jgi:hypothetical protein
MEVFSRNNNVSWWLFKGNYGYNSDGYDSYNNDENEYYAKYHGIKIVGNRFIYGGKGMI